MKRKASETAAKTTGQILRDNICTLFNLLNLLIAIALIFVHAWSNLFFVPVVALNTIIGIAQELKAKRLIEKLTLLSQSNAKIERNGELRSVPIAEVQEQDILLLESGNQICADAVVTDGGIEVNESLLTGESDAVYKKAGDSLLSGSSVISGTCRATVLRVGSDSYASKLTKEAKKTKAMHSELVGSMQKVTRLTSFCIVPLGILLFVEALLFRDSSMYDAVVGTSAGLLGMLPKGLYLLISVSLAAGIITLSKKNVLVQDLYSLENLAHVDVLCLDKTGTLTEGKMQVEKADLFPGTDAEKFHEWMGNFLTHTQDNNATFQAMHAYFKGMDTLSVTDQIPFSSEMERHDLCRRRNFCDRRTGKALSGSDAAGDHRIPKGRQACPAGRHHTAAGTERAAPAGGTTAGSDRADRSAPCQCGENNCKFPERGRFRQADLR